MSGKAIWIHDQKLLDEFNHYKIDNGRSPENALRKLLDIANGKPDMGGK